MGLVSLGSLVSMMVLLLFQKPPARNTVSNGMYSFAMKVKKIAMQAVY